MANDAINTLDHHADEKVSANAIDITKYEGQRVKSSSDLDQTIYLVMWGELHGIPNLKTYNSVFASPSDYKISDTVIEKLPVGEAISDGSFIARADGDPTHYLVSMGRKMGISSPAVVQQFGFKAPVSLPLLALSYIPTGRMVS